MDYKDKDKLARDYLPLARKIARDYCSPNGESYDELCQVAAFGLAQAIDRYDPERGRFSGFAVVTISGTLRRHFRDHCGDVHLPRPLQERCYLVRRTRRELPPHTTVAELAEITELTVAEVEETMLAESARYATSLATPLEDGSFLEDIIGEENPAFDKFEMGLALRDCLDCLENQSQRDILNWYFVEEWTQQEIGNRLGCTQTHAGRLIKKAVKTLQAIAQSRGILTT